MNGNRGPAACTATRHGCPDDDALAALRFGWGEAYRIGWDSHRGWWARRRDDIGGDLTGTDPDALWNAIREDYDLKPVPRDRSTSGAGT